MSRVDANGLLTYEQFAKKKGVTRQMIGYYVKKKRIAITVVMGRNYISKTAEIKPSKTKPGPKKSK
jgi:hypothetical protein